MRARARFLVLLVWASAGTSVSGQAVDLPNPSFESGLEAPAGWAAPTSGSAWCQGEAADGARYLSLAGDGQGDGQWVSDPVTLVGNTAYQFSFQARSDDCTQGTPTAGPACCNRDLGRIPSAWTAYRSVFVTPDGGPAIHQAFHLGQWHADGSVAFDQLALVPVQPLYVEQDGVVLGEGERLDSLTYEFAAPLASPSANHSRPLRGHDCGFNTDRWVFSRASRVTYVHEVRGRRQLEAEVRVVVGYHEAGGLVVEASRDGVQWQRLGSIDGKGGRAFPLPASLLPAARVWVQLRAEGSRVTAGGADPGSFQVAAYTYRARIDGSPLQVRGATRFVAVPQADDTVSVRVSSLGDGVPGGRNVAELEWHHTAQRPRLARPMITLTQGSRSVAYPAPPVTLEPGRGRLQVPYDVPGAGDWELRLTLGGDLGFAAQADLSLSTLYESAYGWRLPASSAAIGLWWASSGWKVGRWRPLPTDSAGAVLIRTAKGEAEAAQLVLRPARPLTRLRLSATDLVGPGGAVLPARQVELLRVAYVPVSTPTDRAGAADWWPDPLPPFDHLDLVAGQNQPVWVRVTAPPGAAPGRYAGRLQLAAEGYAAEVALVVDVFAFSLPPRLSCTTAFGFDWNNVVRYQGLADLDHRRQVLDLYWRNFAAHHISPYDPAPMDPLRCEWNGLEPQFDWTAWDSAMARGLDTLGFSSFRLAVPGLGGGTFYDRREPELLGYPESDPAYSQALGAWLRAMEQHLAERGWLDRAFVYWFDEPDPKDYAFVTNGFAKLRRYAPRLARMLTEQPEPELVGGPTIWCPVSDAFDPDRARPRQAAGEAFWWYVCTGPKAPYAGLFIDHPGTELRVWLWQTWQRGIKGILVWDTNYWTSPAAYPGGLQNPYLDPMGWVSGYGTPAGTRQPWGNGDGRFIYPPEAAAGGASDGPVLQGPVDSIRWEMLRDGLEDYEYLALLSRRLAERSDLDPARRQAYAALLEVPPEISHQMTSFTVDPAPLEARRLAIAAAIEALSGPLSPAAR